MNKQKLNQKISKMIEERETEIESINNEYPDYPEDKQNILDRANNNTKKRLEREIEELELLKEVFEK